jgi:hypothetical protein
MLRWPQLEMQMRLLLPLFLVVGLISCGDKSTDSADDTTATEPEGDDTGYTPDCGDDDEAFVGFADDDSDGFGDTTKRLAQCEPLPEGYSDVSGDCDDANPETYPGADEICDGQDNDCNGATDEEPVNPRTFYFDEDLDGFGRNDMTHTDCNNIEGYVPFGDDCDDTNPDVNPGKDELCSTVGIDDDCNGVTDDLEAIDALTFFPDVDADGHGDMFSTVQSCIQPEGTLTTASDCDDTDATVHIDAEEVCDDVDNNCNAAIDEGLDCSEDTGDADDTGVE